jgi:hypothetical protein
VIEHHTLTPPAARLWFHFDRESGKVAPMSATAIFLSAAGAALVQGIYRLVTGRDLFPANPKGPLYRWFGKASHEDRSEPPAKRLPPP